MEKRELLGKVEKLIKEQTLPKEVKKLIEETYLEYHDAYYIFLKNIQLTVVDSEAQMELNELISSTNRDYEDDIESSKQIENASYAMKIEEMLENIKMVINNMVEERKTDANGISRLSVTSNEEEQTEEGKESKQVARDYRTIKEHTKTNLVNNQCANDIKESGVSEIHSSKEELLTKIALTKKLNTEQIREFKNNFIKFIELIENKAKLKLPLEIRNILDGQDLAIANQIIKIYEQYRKEESLSNREQFVSDLQKKVDENQAIQKAEKISEEQIQDKKLPNDVIK